MSLEEDDCGNVRSLFQCMVSDREVAKTKTFTIGRSKVSYVFKLGPLLAMWLCQSVVNSEWTFSLILDKTTTNQRQKEIDLLFRFWDENINYIVTIYLRSLYFGRATAAHLTCTLTDVMDSDVWHPMGKAVLCIIRCAKHKQDCMEKFE